MSAALHVTAQVEPRGFAQMAYEFDFEVGQFQQVEVVELLVDCVGDFGFDDFVFDEDFADGLVVLVEDVQFAGEAAVLGVFESDGDDGFTETEGFEDVVFCEVYLLVGFDADEL